MYVQLGWELRYKIGFLDATSSREVTRASFVAPLKGVLSHTKFAVRRGRPAQFINFDTLWKHSVHVNFLIGFCVLMRRHWRVIWINMPDIFYFKSKLHFSETHFRSSTMDCPTCIARFSRGRLFGIFEIKLLGPRCWMLLNEHLRDPITWSDAFLCKAPSSEQHSLSAFSIEPRRALPSRPCDPLRCVVPNLIASKASCGSSFWFRNSESTGSLYWKSNSFSLRFLSGSENHFRRAPKSERRQVIKFPNRFYHWF